MTRHRCWSAVGLLLLLGACASRPSGTVEKWLDAVDQGERERAAEFADDALYARVLEGARAPESNERLSRVEVGAATEDSGVARVPFRLRLLTVEAEAPGSPDEQWDRRYTAVLARRGDTWRVVDLQPPADGDRLPSEGGPLPARAPAAAYAVAALAAVVVALLVAVPVLASDARSARRSEASSPV